MSLRAGLIIQSASEIFHSPIEPPEPGRGLEAEEPLKAGRAWLGAGAGLGAPSARDPRSLLPRPRQLLHHEGRGRAAAAERGGSAGSIVASVPPRLRQSQGSGEAKWLLG